MTRAMYDAVTPGNIPPDPRLVAGYADGLYANLGQMRARFPHATIVRIAVRWTTRAQVLDVETGDATPAEAVLWCTKTMAGTPNGELTVYCNTSTWPAVRAAFHAARVAEPQYWIAHYDGVPSIPAGAIAKQYSDPGPYDLSVVADHWPGVDPAPNPTPTPHPEPDMPLTPADVETLLSTRMDDPTAADPTKTVTVRGALWAAYGDADKAAGNTAKLLTQVSALSATVQTLAGLAGKNVDTAAVVAAVEKAIATAVVHVQVDVTQPPTA
jgi:hypothetical protein